MPPLPLSFAEHDDSSPDALALSLNCGHNSSLWTAAAQHDLPAPGTQHDLPALGTAYRPHRRNITTQHMIFLRIPRHSAITAGTSRPST
ncbi:MAG TPA: hypothetical protein VFU35_06640 [Jatrophihabitans sp.]|nr:hypothetical protein [Jatrophihabitans sp.]